MSPACKKCGKTTRLVGVERHRSDPDIDVLTFNCDGCQHYATAEAKTGIYPGPVTEK